MSRATLKRTTLAVAIACALTAPVIAQQRETFTNLKVLPKDIAPEQLRAMMSGFTRALGVRCSFCHVSQEGKPFRHEDFALDDKLTKQTARDMIRMVRDLNQNYLAHLESRANPPIQVQCITCHRGTTQPRMLQDVLEEAYDTGGMDSTLARYQALRDKYYGRFAYDFGEVPLTEVAHHADGAGRHDDAARLLALNVEMNPNSMFAKRQHAAEAIELAFQSSGADSGVAAYRRFQERYGPSAVSEEQLNQIAYDLLEAHHVEPAIAAFKLNVAEHPGSANVYDGLGEAYMNHSDWKLATQAYKKVLELDPGNENAKKMLDEIKVRSKHRRS